MTITITYTAESPVEAAKFLNTLVAIQQNTDAEKAEKANVKLDTKAVTGEVIPPAKATEEKPKKAAKAKAEAPAPAAAEGEEEIDRDTALGFLRDYATAKKLGGKELIAYLQQTFGVPKFGDIPAKRYGELKALAESVGGAAVEDPLA